MEILNGNPRHNSTGTYIHWWTQLGVVFLCIIWVALGVIDVFSLKPEFQWLVLVENDHK